MPATPTALDAAAPPATDPTLGNAEWAAAVDAVVDARQADPRALVQILREVRAEPASGGWLPPAVLARIAARLGRTRADVLGVASFYRFLHTAPAGRTRLLFSDNVTDRHAGARVLAERLCERLGMRVGEVSPDGRVGVAMTSCIGLGDQGPAVLVNHHHVLTRMDAARIDPLAALLQDDTPVDAWPSAWFRVDDTVQLAGPLLGGTLRPGQAIAAALQRGADATLQSLHASKLRGRGGAGFATGTKWSLARQAPVPEGGTRVVVCNADEGEPGTFKDRVLLMRDADAVFEGMTVAARVLDARRGFVYLRGEYRWMLDRLEGVLERRRAQGWLGRDIGGVAGHDFDIEIHLGAGAYVCGEESALIESLEGRRGVPRIRPPFPVEHGYLGQPTVVNNVETYAAAAHIALQGGAWWAAMGTASSAGTKLHSVSGDVERPGVYELPWGTTIGDLLERCGGRDALAVQVGGPSGLFLSSAEFGRRFAFDDVPTAGAFMVFDRRRDPFEIAHGFADFFAHESCGFCTPCRVGTELVKRRMDKLAAGLGSRFEADELAELETLLHRTTHCGLGATATNPLRDTLQRFPEAYARRAAGDRFRPAFDLEAELLPARRATGRRDIVFPIGAAE